MRISCTCFEATPHDFRASVRVFGEDGIAGPFCTLDLTIGEDTVTVMLPPHSYQRARDIADVWPRLVDQAAPQPIVRLVEKEAADAG